MFAFVVTIEISTIFLASGYEINFLYHIFHVYLFSFFNQLHSFIHRPHCLFRFFHIFNILEVWCIFLRGKQQFGSIGIGMDLSCVSTLVIVYIIFISVGV